MIDTEIIISELKRFAKTTGGEYVERGDGILVSEVKYSNGLITIDISEEAFVYMVLMSMYEKTADGGRVGGTAGVFKPEYIGVYHHKNEIFIRSPDPPLVAYFTAKDGHVDDIVQVVETSTINRVHRTSIGRQLG